MKLRNLVAMAHVESVARSIDFYARLGFSVRGTFTSDGEDEPTWASLHADRAELMVTRDGRSASAREHSVLFYLYCDDIAEARAALQAAGIACGEVSFPFWSPRGEFAVRDPDGYVLMVSHT